MENKWKAVVEKLIEKNLTIATMESCTGGMIASEITNISGASSIIEESYVTYSNNAKIKLGVNKGVIDKYTVYSENVAIEMANVVRNVTKSNIGIGVTGQLGRLDPNNKSDSLNKVWYAINYNGNIVTNKIEVPDNIRKVQKDYVIKDISNKLLSLLDGSKI